MKKVININFQGRVLPIEEAAYEGLQRYIESLRSYFIDEEGREEIINDIESRIAELFEARLKVGATCITESDLDAVISSIGRPEDFGGEEEQVKSRLEREAAGNASGHSRASYDASGRRRFYRTEDDKVIAGVCGGIAAYIGIDVMVVRIALLVMAAAGFGFGVVVYALLWAITPSTASKVIGAPRKRLMRDGEERMIGGVCRGLSWYFGVNVWVPRLLFLLPFVSIVFQWSNTHWFDMPDFVRFSFSPAATLIYIVLWLALPEAASASDRLEMRGEPVNLASIRANFSADMRGMEDRIKKFGKDAGTFAQERSLAFQQKAGSAPPPAPRNGVSGAFALLIKVFVYFILSILLFTVIVTLFVFGVVGTGFMPLRNYVLEGPWQELFAWGTLIFFIWVPVVAIITGIIRRLMKAKKNRFITATFASLWVLGAACVAGLIVSLVGNFTYHNEPAEERFALQPVDKIILTSNTGDEYFRPRRWLQFEPFATLNEDTLFLNNVQLRIVASPNDSFQVRLVKASEGASPAEASRLAGGIRYSVFQQDSLLILPKGIPITKAEKFRNQLVYLTVMVPVGKRIEVSSSSYETPGFVYNNNNEYYRHRRFRDDWGYDTEYIMLADGLHEVGDLRKSIGNDEALRNIKPDSLQQLVTIRERQRAQAADLVEQRRRVLQRELDSLDEEED